MTAGTLPVRAPQTSGHVPRPVPLRSAYAYLGLYPCEVDPDSEHRTVREPDRRWCAPRAEVLVQLARGRRLQLERGLL